MEEFERFGVAVFVVLLLGGSFVAAVHSFAADHVLIVAIGYVLVAGVVLFRLLPKGSPRE